MTDYPPWLTQRNYPLNFFLCNILDASPKDDLSTMEHPMFVLSTKRDTRIRTYEHNVHTVTVIPSILGHATIFDKDILIYCVSQLMEALNRKRRDIHRTVRLTAYDLLRATHRPTDGDSYRRLKMALDRLAGTRIKTNLKTNGTKITDAFGLIDRYRIVEKSPVDGQMVAIDITLSQWLFNAVLAREVLTLNPTYFQLRKPLERRLYELARKHCGKQSRWKICLTLLHKKTGSTAQLKMFRHHLKVIARNNPLPDYAVHYSPEEDSITFLHRSEAVQARAALKQALAS
ncbi:MAG: replication initiator protein A [Cyanobacteria bacterium P01_F01_bin.86]